MSQSLFLQDGHFTISKVVLNLMEHHRCQSYQSTKQLSLKPSSGVLAPLSESSPHTMSLVQVIYTLGIHSTFSLASLAGRKHEELAEMLDESKLLSGEKLPLMDRAKLLIYKTLQKHAFIAIFLLASVCISYCLILDSL